MDRGRPTRDAKRPPSRIWDVFPLFLEKPSSWMTVDTALFVVPGNENKEDSNLVCFTESRDKEVSLAPSLLPDGDRPTVSLGGVWRPLVGSGDGALFPACPSVCLLEVWLEGGAERRYLLPPTLHHGLPTEEEDEEGGVETRSAGQQDRQRRSGSHQGVQVSSS